MSFFIPRPNKEPKIYGYTETSPEFNGLIKVGYTERKLKERLKELKGVKGPKDIKRIEVLFEESSMRNDGTFFKDYEVHKVLTDAGIERVGGEWFRCSLDEVKSAVIAVKERKSIDVDRVFNFKLRPEQKEAVEKTKNYFKSYVSAEKRTPHFLWNCKMRFGKTFSAYKLAQEMNWKKVLILTFKPAVENSWKDDLESHIDFKGWQFISRSTQSFHDINNNKPFVCFASFQDFLGKTKSGGIKLKNKWAHKVEWDCIILDEYHYGSWRDAAKELYESEEKKEQKESMGVGIEDWNEDISPLKTKHYLYLSGTPFRAIESGEFIEEQVFNWTYSDEQKSKSEWEGPDNPYASLPQMVLMTYQLPDSIREIALDGEYNEFDLNEFFSAIGEKENAKFVHKNEVQKWLDLIRGSYLETTKDNLKLGSKKPPLPFSDTRLLQVLKHTFWFMPSVASCHAMKNLLEELLTEFSLTHLRRAMPYNLSGGERRRKGKENRSY